MKNILLNSFFRAAAAFALLLAAGACKDDVALPMQRVALNTHAILAPSFATTLSFDVEANCDWTISVAGDDTSWAELSQTEATGMATVAVSIAENNTSGSRALTIRVAAKRNAAVVEELSFVQASATAEGYLSIPDLRKLAADGDYSVTQDVKMRGIVVSSVQDNNYYDNCIALQSALKANCGITLRTDEVLYRKPGEELEIDLKPALDEQQLDKRLLADFAKYANHDFQNGLDDLLPQKLIPVVIELSGIPGRQKVHDLTREQRQSLLRVLKHFPMEVSAPCPVTDAIVTSGGVKVGEVDPKTMESKLVKNLYFAGELLDTDAYTGGFNLQIAWATGRLAGQSAANEKE